MGPYSPGLGPCCNPLEVYFCNVLAEALALTPQLSISGKTPSQCELAIGPPGKIGKNLAIFGFFRSIEKMASDGPKWGQEDFFPTNPGLAEILGRTDLNFEKFYFFHFLDPKFPDAASASAAADGRTLRSQPDPSPNAPRDQIRRKGPCCDFLTCRPLTLTCDSYSLCITNIIHHFDGCIANHGR